METAIVYFTKDITPESLIKIYEALGRELEGKVAIKISSGEPGGHNYLKPELIGALVSKLNGTIVECNTAYPGKRMQSEDHWQAIEDHGFKDIAPCDIMDEDGDIPLAVSGGKHLKENFVGAHFQNYNSMLVLSHFKGHAMGGFGGALKNMSIGIASSRGKIWIHGSGESEDPMSAFGGDHDSFLESMAEACQSVISYMGQKNIAYINVANNLSIDCDCDANPADPEMADIGIFASLDPVALDQATYDAIYASPDTGKASLIGRMESLNAIHTVEEAAALSLGSREYAIQSLDYIEQAT